MRIQICSGVGVGPTALAAFDKAALSACGLNHNLIFLSSFLPAGSEVSRSPDFRIPLDIWGQRVYAVIARRYCTVPGEQAWAGVGWAQDREGRGMFVEHVGPDEESVRRSISATLDFMIAERKMDILSRDAEVRGVVCEKEPACAVVLALYCDWTAGL